MLLLYLSATEPTDFSSLALSEITFLFYIQLRYQVRLIEISSVVPKYNKIWMQEKN